MSTIGEKLSDAAVAERQLLAVVRSFDAHVRHGDEAKKGQ
jgi:hypothetical protein